MDEPNRKPDARKPDKAQRLAEALRENLRKRKAQERARREGVETPSKIGTPPDDTGTEARSSDDH